MKMENHPWGGFLDVGVEFIVAVQSTGHRFTLAPEPRVETNRFRVSCLKIERNWDGIGCRRARVMTAIDKGC